jgi:hypothetical protein
MIINHEESKNKKKEQKILRVLRFFVVDLRGNENHALENSVAPMRIGCAGVDLDVALDFGRGA